MHSTIVEIKHDEESDALYIDLGQDTMDELGWDEGVTISWEDNHDGSWTLKKKEKHDWYDFFLPDAPLYKDTEEMEMTETKSDIFELEQSLMRCWGLIDDIKTVYNADELYLDQDKMMNALLGLAAIGDLKFQECFKHFEAMCKEYWELKKK